MTDEISPEASAARHWASNRLEQDIEGDGEELLHDLLVEAWLAGYRSETAWIGQLPTHPFPRVPRPNVVKRPPSPEGKH